MMFSARLRATTAPEAPASTTLFTMAQIMTHNASTSCYTVIKGTVYDLTEWIKLHQNEARPVINLCGKDGTALFFTQHAGEPEPEQEFTTFKIGIVQQ
jgi:cytochrome b involved in lipid metabolism